MVDTTAAPVPLPTIATGDLVLRVCGTSRDGQFVRLRSAKCTVGSGPQCTLRLLARGVGPMHCLIVRGRFGTVARRWSRDTRLNGRDFTDEALAPGDRLGIGPIELEVVDLGALPRQPLAPLPAPSQDMDEATAQLRLGHEALDHQRRELDARWQELSARSAELETRGHELELVRSELDGARQDLERHQRQWQVDSTELENRLRERADEVNARWQEVDMRLKALGDERRQWDADRTEREEQLNQVTEQLENRQAELRAAEELFHATAARAPAAAAAVEVPQGLGPPVQLSSGIEQGEAGVAEAGGEESVEEYMARLLSRVQATASESCPAEGREPPAPRGGESQPTSQIAQGTPTVATEEVRGGLPKRRESPRAPQAPRAVAPEKSADLSAMRELAAVSAQRAISVHARRKALSARRLRLLMAAISLVAGCGLLWVWTAFSAAGLAFYAAVVCFIAAGFWGLQYVLLAVRMIRAKLGRAKSDLWQTGPDTGATERPPQEP